MPKQPTAAQVARAFALADREMFSALKSYGCSCDGGKYFREPCGYGWNEFHEAAEWLLQRGYLQRDQDQGGPFLRVVRRPVEDA